MTDTVQLCVMGIGPESYVIDIARVEEIIPPARVLAVPGAPRFVEGVINLRGSMLPVIDVRKRLGVAARGVPRKERLVVSRVGARRVGLLVDSVDQVIRVPVSAFKPAPMTSVPGRSPHVIGVCLVNDAVRFMLDVLALVAEDG